LRAGLTDGALARWRTLYEVAVTAHFIVDSGSEAAERYLAHERLRAIDDMQAFQHQTERSGEEPLSDEQLQELRDERARLLNTYGADLDADCGWASHVIRKKTPIRFIDIERAVDLSSVRPLYKHASAEVHGGADGLRGTGILDGYDDVFHAGPSNAGLEEPGRLTAVTLALIVFAPFKCQPSMDRLITAATFGEMASRCQASFAKGEKALRAADNDNRHP